MKKIDYITPSAQKIYNDYIKRVERCTRSLSVNDQQEALMEINSHIYEATHGTLPEDEINVLVDILERLGPPEVVLQPLVAYKKTQQASSTFNPVHVYQALYLNISNGFAYLVLAGIYLLITSFGILIILKIIYPSHTGLFMRNHKFFAFGFTTELPSGITEHLGDWFIIVIILLMAILYGLNTLLFRLLKKA